MSPLLVRTRFRVRGPWPVDWSHRGTPDFRRLSGRSLNQSITEISRLFRWLLFRFSFVDIRNSLALRHIPIRPKADIFILNLISSNCKHGNYASSWAIVPGNGLSDQMRGAELDVTTIQATYTQR